MAAMGLLSGPSPVTVDCDVSTMDIVPIYMDWFKWTFYVVCSHSIWLNMCVLGRFWAFLAVLFGRYLICWGLIR